MKKTSSIDLVGKVIIDGNMIIKEYEIYTRGSSYKKVGTDIMLMRDAGFVKILIRINNDSPYKDIIQHLARMAANYCDCNIEFELF